MSTFAFSSRVGSGSDEHCLSGRARTMAATLSSNAASNNCKINAQLQSLSCRATPKMIRKIYFLYNFWCAQTCSFRAIFGLLVRSLTITSCVVNCILVAHLHSRPYTTAVEFSSNLSVIYTKWCAQSFPPIFGLFAMFVLNFVKIVAPSSN